MGTAEDREHFLSYRRQTEIKHTILEKYLPAYFQILGSYHGRLFYIDAFAGKGHYLDVESGERFAGSPIRALEMLAARPALADRVLVLLSEKDPVNFKDLEAAIAGFEKSHPKLRKPGLLNGTFQDLVAMMQSELGGDQMPRLPPTFLFVDPCGIAGADLQSIARIVKNDGCEAFIFFNIDGVRRTAGLDLDRPSPTLIQLYGSEEAARALCEGLKTREDPQEREDFALAEYRRQLVSVTGAQFVLPFRIESETRAATSHYLIHVSKVALGFKIMKDIMWDLGGDDGAAGGLHLQQASGASGQLVFDTTAAEVDAAILGELRKGEASVAHFTEGWACRSTDFVASKCYKRRLIALESAGSIEVISEGKVVSADQRLKRKGVPTLADKYSVRLRAR